MVLMTANVGSSPGHGHPRISPSSAGLVLDNQHVPSSPHTTLDFFPLIILCRLPLGLFLSLTSFTVHLSKRLQTRLFPLVLGMAVNVHATQSGKHGYD